MSVELVESLDRRDGELEWIAAEEGAATAHDARGEVAQVQEDMAADTGRYSPVLVCVCVCVCVEGEDGWMNCGTRKREKEGFGSGDEPPPKLRFFTIMGIW